MSLCVCVFVRECAFSLEHACVCVCLNILILFLFHSRFLSYLFIHFYHTNFHTFSSPYLQKCFPGSYSHSHERNSRVWGSRCVRLSVLLSMYCPNYKRFFFLIFMLRILFVLFLFLNFHPLFLGLRKDYTLLNENLIFEGSGNGHLQLKMKYVLTLLTTTTSNFSFILIILIPIFSSLTFSDRIYIAVIFNNFLGFICLFILFYAFIYLFIALFYCFTVTVFFYLFVYSFVYSYFNFLLFGHLFFSQMVLRSGY